MGFNIDDLKKASNEASIAASIKTAADKKKALGESLFTEVIKELKANGVDEKTINSLETEIGRATDKNEATDAELRRRGYAAVLRIPGTRRIQQR